MLKFLLVKKTYMQYTEIKYLHQNIFLTMQI
jgi:hypothetical protein